MYSAAFIGMRYHESMTDYRRYRVPGGTYFLTVNLLERRADLLTRHIDALRQAVRRTRSERPFYIYTWAVCPDHMHRVTKSFGGTALRGFRPSPCGV